MEELNIGYILLTIISSSLAATLVSSGKDIFIFLKSRKHKLQDENNETEEEIENVQEHQKLSDERLEKFILEVHEYIKDHSEISNAIVRSNKLLMQDRISFIAQRCIAEEEITYETRKMLHSMWDEYHNSWKGNGDLNILMREVDALPLKINK